MPVTHTGDIELGKSEQMVVAWWGQQLPTNHMLYSTDVNAIVCHPQEEDTMVSQKATGWVGYFVWQANGVADIYGVHGEAQCSVILYYSDAQCNS